ncbi:hypothetical protein MHN79_18715 [Vibrio sp. Of14-4]|uniref:hypothetical protein n=1 Tax=Vibrio sp. Of14-4 TaxID=2724878 RepID=UPI001EF34A7A|nr:hypothetical protein [Vibrio sp. Of14-4]MCG7491518.1 hypothetical protein [Vibrio sp. Of14-4]
MNDISDLGNYLERLNALLTTTLGQSVKVQYSEAPDSQQVNKPIVSLPLPSIEQCNYLADDRYQHLLKVTILIKPAVNHANSTLAVANVAHKIITLLTGQLFLDPAQMGNNDDGESMALDAELDCLDEPQAINAKPLDLSSEMMGYAIRFTQKVRYGSPQQETFWVKSLNIKESKGDEKVIYEFEPSNT